MPANPPGQPTKFCPEMTAKILEGIKACLVMTQACSYAGISRWSVYNWLEKGMNDIKNDICSEYAQFFYSVKRTQADEIKELIETIRLRKKNWQALAWLLERCFREDFGQDAGIIQDLLAKCEKLEQDFKRVYENPLQGAMSNG